jgi:hypothetical protein
MRPSQKFATLLAGGWSSVALASGGNWDGLLVALALVAAVSVAALVSGIATVWLVVLERRAPTLRTRTWCRRFAVIDFVLAAGGGIWFVAARESADAWKLLGPVAALTVAGILALRRSRPIPVDAGASK